MNTSPWKDEVPVVLVTQDYVDASVQCSICLEDLRLSEPVMRLSCCHLYHEPCISPWLDQHNVCPNCRQKVISRNDPEPSHEDEYVMEGILNLLERFLVDVEGALQSYISGSADSITSDSYISLVHDIQVLFTDSEDSEDNEDTEEEELHEVSNLLRAAQYLDVNEPSNANRNDQSNRDLELRSEDEGGSCKRKRGHSDTDDSDEDSDEDMGENMRLNLESNKQDCDIATTQHNDENELRRGCNENMFNSKESKERTDLELRSRTKETPGEFCSSNTRFKRRKTNCDDENKIIPVNDESSEEEVDCTEIKNLIPKYNGPKKEGVERNTSSVDDDNESSDDEIDLDNTEIGILVTKLYDIVQKEMGDEFSLDEQSDDEGSLVSSQAESDKSDRSVPGTNDEKSTDNYVNDTHMEESDMEDTDDDDFFVSEVEENGMVDSDVFDSDMEDANDEVKKLDESKFELSKSEKNPRQQNHLSEEEPYEISNKVSSLGRNPEIQKTITELWDIVTNDPLFRQSQQNRRSTKKK